MSDDLEHFHARNIAGDPQYAIARQLFELGEAVAQLRESARLTRGQLGKLLGVKARDIEIIEEETPRSPAGLLEAALSLLVQKTAEPQTTRNSDIADSLRTVRHLRPALVAA
jgi:DNA-binding XRE family transcriptional regulator